MNFERNEQLKSILDDLERNDQTHFRNLQQKILAKAAASGRTWDSSTAALLCQGFQEELEERARKVFSEIARVLESAYISDFDTLVEALKSEWNRRMAAVASVASSKIVRPRDPDQREPSENALFDYLEGLKPKWIGEIELFCEKLRVTQEPRLFLNAGEVFAANRAARAIFSAARKSLDIIDTYLGPRVFDMLEVSVPSVRIRLITNRADNPTKIAYKTFNQQFKNRSEFRLSDPNTDRLHDRFIVVDGIKALHLGAAIKDLGLSDSIIDSAQLDPHKMRFEQLWLRGQPVQ
jgi:hypothetical protein